VLPGSFAGHVGRVAAKAPDGKLHIFMDDCCQPLVAPSDLRLVKPGSVVDRIGRAHRTIEQNPEVRYTEALAEGRNHPTGKPF